MAGQCTSQSVLHNASAVVISLISVIKFTSGLQMSVSVKVRQSLVPNHLSGKKVSNLQLSHTGEGTGNYFFPHYADILSYAIKLNLKITPVAYSLYFNM